MKGIFLFAVILNVLLGTPAVADFAKGLAAAERGDYTTALKEWRPLAEQGESDARSNLGEMYQHGYGVIQDFRLAHMWLNISASQGNKKAVVKRNMLELIMTPDDISRAHELSRECQTKDFMGC